MTTLHFTYKAAYMLSSLLICSSLSGSEQVAFTYAKAQSTDAESIDALMLTEGINDSNKIVILPNKFRKPSIESSIEKGRFYVALHNELLVGYKKLFLVTDADERTSLLTEEIRCINGSLVDQHLFTKTTENDYLSHPLTEGATSDFTGSICIYDGADFTKNNFRGQGINQELTNQAFELIEEDTHKRCKETEAERIILLYGLTYLNDYNEQGEGKSRTPSIVQSFALFIHALTGLYPNEIRHSRYKAFMPTFELDAEECRPNPDSKSIPGYGNLLEVTLPVTTKEQS
ncbi:hypothetical protein H0W26_00845 [Candidatus Dependentiae bacterium]|nr:hypothetical protein [Candidatus Dependentiae bacterium]